MTNMRIAGVCYLKFAGAQFPVKGKPEYSVNETTNETVTGLDEVHGYLEKPHPPHIKCTLSDLGEVSTKKLQKTKGTAMLELANGKTIVIRDGWVVGDIDVDAEAGEYGIEIQGKKGEELP